MPAIPTNDTALTSKLSYNPYKDATRPTRTEATKRPPFITITNNSPSYVPLWPETPSPRPLPETPRIRTVCLPMYSPSCDMLCDTPQDARHSPSYFPQVPSPISTPAGPFQAIRNLHSGAYGCAVAAKDLSNNQRVCLKAIEKSRVEGKAKALNAMRTELTAYKMIANAPPNAFVMDCHSVFQDESRVFFEMVSPHDS